jgi:hypothetical protein
MLRPGIDASVIDPREAQLRSVDDERPACAARKVYRTRDEACPDVLDCIELF